LAALYILNLVSADLGLDILALVFADMFGCAADILARDSADGIIPGLPFIPRSANPFSNIKLAHSVESTILFSFEKS